MIFEVFTNKAELIYFPIFFGNNKIITVEIGE